jgi:hypothetical protein
MTAWEKRVAELRPRRGDRVEYACARGTVLACEDSRDGWAVLVEWDDTDRPGRRSRRSPEAFDPAAFHVGLVKVLP